jgi:hypothetical protein
MRTSAFFSAINLPTMPYSEDLYEFAGIINFVDDSIITKPNSPVVFGTGQFMAACRTWGIRKCSNPGNDAIINYGR